MGTDSVGGKEQEVILDFVDEHQVRFDVAVTIAFQLVGLALKAFWHPF